MLVPELLSSIVSNSASSCDMGELVVRVEHVSITGANWLLFSAFIGGEDGT